MEMVTALTWVLCVTLAFIFGFIAGAHWQEQ
jgi:uncharacterized protein YneF (UPF0154 family)